ncbi:MAG: YbhB/YbcL family Raf kinase inhibitor-like protein [Sinobacteraceae bacterium]|nr:YbhB/YbcL family Raf kinase inhibitor-like protein [Nevskiaceae bacterium]
MLEKLPASVGQALHHRRAGLEALLTASLDATHGPGLIKLSSPAFVDNSPIPVRFTADGEGFSPPLEWCNVPPEASSLALIVEDADSPTSEPLVHAIVVDIDPRTRALLEGEIASERADMALGIGRNSYLRRAWLPPDPPPGHGVHRYAFQLFALMHGEPFSSAPGRSELARAIRERAVASGCLTGTYERLPESGRLARRPEHINS